MNAVKTAAEEKYQSHKDQIEAGKASKAAADIDLFYLIIRNGIETPHLSGAQQNCFHFERIGFTVAEEREIEDDWHNFSAMNTPDDHPCQGYAGYFYKRFSDSFVANPHIFCTGKGNDQHPTAHSHHCSGKVYRNETISARSHCQFHQVEGLYIDEKFHSLI